MTSEQLCSFPHACDSTTHAPRRPGTGPVVADPDHHPVALIHGFDPDRGGLGFAGGTPLLRVDDLRIRYGEQAVVDGVSFDIEAGEAVGLVVAGFFVVIFPGNIAQYVEGTDAFGLASDGARAARLAFQPVLVAAALWSTGAWSSWRARQDK